MDTHDTAAATLPSTKLSKSLKRKNKNAKETEAKPDFDLTTALPDRNEFRTSLLMPNLSARFSMLREQDDPNTKIGKANDDSVLFPKRQSRLNLFAHNPLTDIAEVSSIYSSFRPPFANDDRKNSISDGYLSDDGASIMGRTRPSEGNNLFGGRQKLYKIPTASTKNLVDGENPVTGAKHMYQNDVQLSLFQQLRQKARQEQEAEEERKRQSSQPTDLDDSELANTPSTTFSRNRGTTSSTHSGPSNRRTSTAATSLASESPTTRQNTSVSRQKSFSTNDDQPSPSPKLNTAGMASWRPPMPGAQKTAHRLSQSRSVANLNEKFGRSNSVFTSAPAHRAMSPLPIALNAGMAGLDFGLKDDLVRSTSKAALHRATSPTAPLHNDDEDMVAYAQTVQPNDRGKATAMGLFKKPQQQFDEQQFSQRQLQMHGGRSSPLSGDSRPESRGSPAPVNSSNYATSSIPEVQNNTRVDSGALSALPSLPATSQAVRSGSLECSAHRTSDPSRPRKQSSASTSAEAAANVKARVESLIRRENAQLVATEQELPDPVIDNGHPGVDNGRQRQMSEASEGTKAAATGTFFNNFDASEDEMEEPAHEAETQDSRPVSNVHPALRDGMNDFVFGAEVTGHKQSERQSGSSDRSVPPPPVGLTALPEVVPAFTYGLTPDSPTMGLTPGLGLSGLVRSHLRMDSDHSSIMPPSSPGLAALQPYDRPRERSLASMTRSINPPESLRSDPWELDRVQHAQPSPQIPPPAPSPTTVMSMRAQQMLGRAMMLKQQAANQAQQQAQGAIPEERHSDERTSPWQEEIVSSHQRGESTETQKESQAFDDELAERRRRIQEGLRNAAEGEKRPRSPARHDIQNLPAQAFQALRHKTSKVAVPRAGEPQPKAMRMLGINGPLRERISPRMPSETWREEEQVPQPDYMRQPQQHSPTMGVDFPSGRGTPAGRNQYSNSPEELNRPVLNSTTPSSREPRRDRAASSAADRSRSRVGKCPEDEGHPPFDPRGRPMNGQTRSPPQGERRAASRGPQDQRAPSRGAQDQRAPSRGAQDQRAPSRGSQDPRTYVRSASAMSGKYRSNSRPPNQSYFDSRAQPPMMPNNIGVNPPRASPRPTPQSPMSSFHQTMNSPALDSALPSPALSNHNHNHNVTTPFPTGRITPTGRKRSVVKGMISEPTFISSTSSVPLVGLPQNGPAGGPSPPIPSMNPRRRGNTADGNARHIHVNPAPYTYTSRSQVTSPLPAMPEAPHSAGHASMDHGPDSGLQPQPRSRNRLRKTSSEGGNMAAKARQQAFMAERKREDDRSPNVAVFPNRSATSLSMRAGDGAMF